MDSKDFLTRMKEVRKIGDEFGKKGGAGFVTQIEISFGFWAYGGLEHDRLKFWKLCKNNGEAETIKAEVQATLDQAGVKEEADWCLRIFADKNVLGRDPFEYDSNAFYPAWQWDKKDDGPETCVSLILDQIEKNGLPLEKLFWGRYQLKSNPHHVAKGEDGKKESKKDGKMYWPNFVLPVEKFLNEQAAKAAAGGESTGSNDSKWSDMARATFEGNMESLDQSISEIQAWYKKAMNKEATTGYPLPVPLTPVTVKKQIADAYTIETADIDIALSETPF